MREQRGICKILRTVPINRNSYQTTAFFVMFAGKKSVTVKPFKHGNPFVSGQAADIHNVLFDKITPFPA